MSKDKIDKNTKKLSKVMCVRNKSCEPDLRFSEQTDFAGGTNTLPVISRM